MTIDAGNLTDLIRECAIELWENGVTNADQFVTAFNRKFGHLLSDEQKQYCVEKWVHEAGKKMMHKVGKELRKMRGSSQYDLPMDLKRYDIPDTLTMPGRWVPLHEADEADLDAYQDMLQGNADECLGKITDFAVFAERVRPVLRANPGWKTGDALRWLKAQERVLV
jgi:hypothetical protein